MRTPANAAQAFADFGTRLVAEDPVHFRVPTAPTSQGSITLNWNCLILPIAALAYSFSVQAQVPPIKFTPPGLVLMNACQQINSNDPSARAMTDRAYCFRFIESALMMDRYQHAEQNERFRQWEAGKGPLITLPASFCYLHSAEWGVSAIQVAAVAKQFVTYLQAQPESKLDRLSNSDDTQMRLLMGFLKTQYPCRAK